MGYRGGAVGVVFKWTWMLLTCLSLKQFSLMSKIVWGLDRVKSIYKCLSMEGKGYR